MNIRFTSSLTPEDENAIAPAVLKALTSILDLLPIAYSIRIDTSDAQVYQHSGIASESRPDAPPTRTLAESTVPVLKDHLHLRRI